MLVARCEVARLDALRVGHSDESKERLLREIESCESTLDTLSGAGVHPSVNAAYFRAAAEFYRQFGPPSKFYSNGLSFLAYADVEAMDAATKINWAVALAMAALAGKDIYNFGEVLENGVMADLNGTEHEWLVELLTAFNRGDVGAFDAVVAKNKDVFGKTVLASAEAMAGLREKMVLLSVVEMVFRRAPDDRTLSFAEVAKATGKPLDQVEWTLMRAMSVGLIKGLIDGVDERVHITWLRPRVLQPEQLAALKESLEQWDASVDSALSRVRAEAPAVFL